MALLDVEISFFFLIVFRGTEAHIVYILLCHPSEESIGWSIIPYNSPSKDWQSTVPEAGEIAEFEPRTADSQSGIATNEPPSLPGVKFVVYFVYYKEI